MTRPFAAKKKIVQLTSLSYLQKSVKREKEYEDTFGEVPLELLVFHDLINYQKLNRFPLSNGLKEINKIESILNSIIKPLSTHVPPFIHIENKTIR